MLSTDPLLRYGEIAGLSSSNGGGVGSLLQAIEQSEKSNAGETEQNDDFLDFINCEPGNTNDRGAASSLFIS